MSDLSVPDGMALECQTCHWRPAEALTMGVVVAHFGTEHHTTDVRLDLVVLCPRCDKSMRFDYSQPRHQGGGFVDVFQCDGCHRTRQIHREGT